MSERKPIGHPSRSRVPGTGAKAKEKTKVKTGTQSEKTSKANILQQLRQNIRQLESTTRCDDNANAIQTGIAAVDQALPQGGYRRGTLVEWIISPRAFGRLSRSSGSTSADYLSLATAIATAKDGGAIVIADPHRQFHPPAAAAMGLDLGNIIILRPSTEGTYTSIHQNELYWAIDQSLRCSAVAAVWGALDCIGERWFRRFQLSAESSGSLGLFVRPPTALNRPSWSEVQWQIAPGRTNGGAKHLRHVQLKLLRCRGGQTGRQINLAIDTITGSVHSPAVHGEHERNQQTSAPPHHGSFHTHHPRAS